MSPEPVWALFSMVVSFWLLEAGCPRSLNYELKLYSNEKVSVDILIKGEDEAANSFSTERCEIENHSITCTKQSPIVTDYSYYPELLLVDENFGK